MSSLSYLGDRPAPMVASLEESPFTKVIFFVSRATSNCTSDSLAGRLAGIMSVVSTVLISSANSFRLAAN